MNTFKFKTKDHWRRWIWNQYKNRLGMLGCSARNSIVVYLAGPEDLDRDIAISKGFSAHNLIAVDTDQNVVRQLRNRGVLAIQGNLSEVISSWPPHIPIHILHADFCATYPTIQRFVTSAIHSPFVFVFGINCLRGRDRDPAFIDALKSGGISWLFPNVGKHRGKLIANIAHMHAMCTTWDHHSIDATVWNRVTLAEFKNSLATQLGKIIKGNMAANFQTYRSTAGNQRMDSTVFVNPLLLWNRIGRLAVHNQPRDTDVSRKIAAILATRTRCLDSQTRAKWGEFTSFLKDIGCFSGFALWVQRQLFGGATRAGIIRILEEQTAVRSEPDGRILVDFTKARELKNFRVTSAPTW